MTSAPSISYSITVRLEVPSGGSAVSEITTTVERAGGLVTALDVTASDADALDVTCATSDTDHAPRHTNHRPSANCRHSSTPSPS